MKLHNLHIQTRLLKYAKWNPKTCKATYELHKKFQNEMACKLPWVELIVDKIEKIHQVYYKVCIKIRVEKNFWFQKLIFCGSMQGKGKLG
jgi:hypothetical protein